MDATVATVATVATGCGSSDGSTTPTVTPSEGYTAIVEWEVARHDPLLDENGNVILPVIYLVAESGGTIDIGIQADVVEATSDIAVVRFSDESSDSLDEGLEGTPVKDDGVMLILAPLPASEASITTNVGVYRTADDQTSMQLDIVATDEGAKVVAAAEQVTVTE